MEVIPRSRRKRRQARRGGESGQWLRANSVASKALPATPGNRTHRARAREAGRAGSEEKGAAEAVAAKMAAWRVIAQGARPKCYGSVTTADIAEALANLARNDKRKLGLREPIKKLGDTPPLKLHPR
jgi:ribosomal protein L9